MALIESSKYLERRKHLMGLGITLGKLHSSWSLIHTSISTAGISCIGHLRDEINRLKEEFENTLAHLMIDYAEEMYGQIMQTVTDEINNKGGK